ncbi:hypothetical protein ACFLQN_03185 [Candidatus Aenigmatarchaeota archaeon]
MGFGSYLRFFVGLLISIEVLRHTLAGNGLSNYAFYLSIAFILLTFVFILEKAGVIPRV